MFLTSLFEHDKKFLIKVIAGLILLVITFAFYLIKVNTAAKDADLEIINSDIEQLEQPTYAAIEEKSMIMVDVAGAVINPSVVALPEGSRIFEAVKKAGGLTEQADTRSTNQAEILVDGQKIYIPTKQELSEEYGKADISVFSGQEKALRPSLININTADSETLQQLSGVGPATAEKIIDYRNQNGKFSSIEEIKNVSGIGDKTFEKFKNKITV